MCPSQRVFQVPELAALICSFSTTLDCARLLRTNRMLFNVTIPFVWRHVDGVQHLLGLISTCGIILDHLSNELALIAIGYNPTLGEVAPFLHFDFYAPHVRSLDVYGSRKNTFKVTGWSQLIRRAQQKLLLPNLRSITIGTPIDAAMDASYSLDQLTWIMVFASASLMTLSIPVIEAHTPPVISYRAASALLKALTHHHPNLHELSLFPDAGLGHHQSDGESSLLTFVSGEPFYHYLVGANELRHLSGTMAWLQPEPRLVLSKLPLLESVTVYSMFDPPNWENEPTVPEDSFSSLRRLSMHEVDPYDVLQVLRTRHMFQQVTSLVLDFNIDEFPLEESIDFWLINDFFPILSNIPRLCDFSVKIPSLESEETLMVIRPPVLDILSALPLQSVTLGNMECPFIPWPDNFEIAWPLVTKLSMPDQTVSLDFLHPFAALPKLEYLELKLDVEWIFDPTIPEPGPRAPLRTLVTTHYQVANRNVWDADQIVRWLLTHWPNLSRMVCPDPDPTKEPADTLDREYFDLLNRRLKELRVLEHATE